MAKKREVSTEAPQEAVERQPAAKPKRLKATYYIREDQDTALTAIQLAERKHASRRCDKSELIREAIDLLVMKYKITC